MSQCPIGAQAVYQWIEEEWDSQAQLARAIGLEPIPFNNALKGRRRFRPVEAYALEELSRGRLSARQLLLTQGEHNNPLAVCLGGAV